MWNKKEMSQLDATLTKVPLTLTFALDIWPWIFKVKLYFGNGRPIVMERKGRETIGCPNVKHQGNESSGCCADWGTFDIDLPWPWPLTLNCQGQIVSQEWEAQSHATKGTGVDRMPWCETLRKWVIRTQRWLGYFWPLPVTLNFEGQIVSREWEARLSWNDRDGSQ